MLIIPAAWETYVGESWNKAGPGKKNKTLSEKSLK
jgi:hypothetical protein